MQDYFVSWIWNWTSDPALRKELIGRIKLEKIFSNKNELAFLHDDWYSLSKSFFSSLAFSNRKEGECVCHFAEVRSSQRGWEVLKF
jgi:hypothetical protein